MSVLNKNIIRGFLIASYVLLLALILFGVSALYSYLNTGADRSSMLHTKIDAKEHYTPKITWKSINNEGRPIDKETLKNIESDYLDAWYVRHVAYKTNLKEGVSDYYTANAREHIFNIISLNTAENTSITSTTLEHNPTIAFFSEDGQLAVLKDENVVEYKRVYKDKALVLETTEVSNYKIILLLEDGFWKIRQLIKEPASKPIDAIKPTNNASILSLKGINYYPQATPWDLFGKDFNMETIAKDFKIIRNAGLNSIRIFIPYDDFGKASVIPNKLKKLKQILDAAETHNLKVVVTLFDFYGDYSVLDWTLNHKHARTIVSKFKDHKAILAWDIKNEPNLDFNSRGELAVTSWLQHLVKLVKSIDPNHPVTIGWSNSKSATVLKDDLDFISFHYYEDLNNLDDTYKTLKSNIPNKPIVLGEFGLSSYNGLWNPFGASEKEQATYHKRAQKIIKKNEMPFISWTLYDFNHIPKEVAGRLPWRKNKQEAFGFIDTEGKRKAAFEFIAE